MRRFAALALFTITANAATLFQWPVGFSNNGPYMLVSAVSNVTVFQPNPGPPTENDIATHQYQHHTRISWFQGATFLATSSAGTNEEDSGQQCVLFVSTNKGVNWMPPIQVVPSQSIWTNIPDWRGTRISYPRNFTLYNGTNYLTCAVDEILGNGGLHGAALISCPVYTNGTIGSIFLISTNAYAAMTNAAGGNITVPPYDPSGALAGPLIADSEIYGCWGGSFPGGEPLSVWVGAWYTGESTPPQSPLASTYVEPNTFSVDGGTQNLYRLWRETGNVFNNLLISQSLSTNGGRDFFLPQPSTWTFPQTNNVPSPGTENTGLRLTDGRYVLIGNPQNNIVQCGIHGRDPLYLAITDTGSTAITNVLAIRQGLAGDVTFIGTAQTLGGAQYPHAIQVGNYLYVSYSIAKQRVGFSRVLIPDLPDNNNDVYVPPVNLNIGSAAVGTLRTAP